MSDAPAASTYAGPGCYPTQVPPHTLIGGPENLKLMFDDQLANQRETMARQRAWEAINLDQAQIASRRAQNAATIDHMLNVVAAVSIATGQTENEQTVSPAGTAASETAKGAVADAGAGIAVGAESQVVNMVNLMTSLTPVIATSIATATAQTLATILPTVLAAAGQSAGTSTSKS